ncbi:MAG: hypothetical protein R3E42_06855 [Burkholderiaceae bacterium]
MVDGEGRTDVVNDQASVDDLLASLGFWAAFLSRPGPPVAGFGGQRVAIPSCSSGLTRFSQKPRRCRANHRRPSRGKAGSLRLFPL